MTIKVSDVSGGPYTHEIDAIRDERQRAKVMGISPDFGAVFAEVEISPGAYTIIADIDKPIELPVGVFTENVVFNDEEVTSEGEAEEAEPFADKAEEESPASEETISEPGLSEAGVESETLNDLQDAAELDAIFEAK